MTGGRAVDVILCLLKQKTGMSSYPVDKRKMCIGGGRLFPTWKMAFVKTQYDIFPSLFLMAPLPPAVAKYFKK